MEARNQIEAAIEHLKNQERNFSLAWDNETKTKANFKIANPSLNKNVEGSLTELDGELIAHIDSTNYSISYVRAKLREEFADLGISINSIRVELPQLLTIAPLLELEIPKVGDIVTTKAFLEQVEAGQLQTGQSVTLQSDISVFAINEDIIRDCNGQPLRNDFDAKFIEQIERRCGNNNLPALSYIRFILISQL